MAGLYDLAIMTVSSAPGTGSAISLANAASVGGVSFLSFANAGVPTGTLIDYAIADSVNGGSEVGTATYSSSAGTQLLSRTPTKSTNGNAAINASSGSLIRISPRAETLPTLDLPNTFASSQAFNAPVTITSTAQLGLVVSGSTTGVGDIQTHRNGTSGAIYLGNSFSNYLYFDGTNFILGATGNVVLGSSYVFLGKNTCHAWAKWVGTTGTISASYNVSSVTRNGTGDYTVNFASALPTADYAMAGIGQGTASVNGWVQNSNATAPSTNVCRVGYIYMNAGSNATYDPNFGFVTITGPY